MRSEPSPRPRRREIVIGPLVIIAATLLAYHGSHAVPFFFDDTVAVTNNPTIRHLARLGTVLSPPAEGGGMMGRPLVNLSLAVNYAIGGTNVAGYHVFNLAIHALAALLLFGLIRRTLEGAVLRQRYAAQAGPLAFATALLWAVHPLQTESVTCVIQRTELLVGLFYLLTLYSFARLAGNTTSRRWQVAAFASCALGMLCKEVMVSAPLMALLYDRTFVSGSFRAAWQQRKSVHLSLAATWLILAGIVLGMGGGRAAAAGFGLGVPWWSYALKQCEAVLTYLKLSVWPHPLVMDYGTDVVDRITPVLPQIAVIAALLAAMLFALRRRPVIGFLMFWVFAILAPSSTILPLVSQTMAEHRMYLPLAALVALLAVATHHLAGRRHIVITLVAACALGVGTAARNHTLQDLVALWNDTAAKAPENPRAHASLGLALSDRGQPREALRHFQRALELDPKAVATWQNIGNAYFALGQFRLAAQQYRQAVALDPRFASGFNNLGATLWELREPEEALANYRAALAIDPNHPGAHQNAARAYFALGRFAEAAAHYRSVTQQQPDSPSAHYDLGLALARAGEIDPAIEHFRTALELQPSATSYVNFGRFLVNSGRMTDAITAFQTALRLEPNQVEAQRELNRLRPIR